MTSEKCDLCSSADPLHLHAKCHNNAPLHATLEGGEIVLRCYVPSCLREVARYRIYQGFPEKFAMQNVIGNQAAEIARLQAALEDTAKLLAQEFEWRMQVANAGLSRLRAGDRGLGLAQGRPALVADGARDRPRGVGRRRA